MLSNLITIVRTVSNPSTFNVNMLNLTVITIIKSIIAATNDTTINSTVYDKTVPDLIQ